MLVGLKLKLKQKLSPLLAFLTHPMRYLLCDFATCGELTQIYFCKRVKCDDELGKRLVVIFMGLLWL